MSKYNVWYFPKGVKTVFGSKKGTAEVTGNKIIISDLAGNTVKEFLITPDFQFGKASIGAGMVIIKQTNGVKYNSLFLSENMIYFFNPRFQMLSVLMFFIGRKSKKAFRQEVLAQVK